MGSDSGSGSSSRVRVLVRSSNFVDHGCGRQFVKSTFVWASGVAGNKNCRVFDLGTTGVLG